MSSSFGPTGEVWFEPFPSLNPQDGESRILEGLGQAKEHDPKYALCLGADGQSHLCKREDVTGHTQCQYDNTCSERELAEEALDRVPSTAAQRLLGLMVMFGLLHVIIPIKKGPRQLQEVCPRSLMSFYWKSSGNNYASSFLTIRRSLMRAFLPVRPRR